MPLSRQICLVLAGLIPGLLSAGCAHEFNLATGQEESLMYGTEKEMRIGDAVARQMEDNYSLVADLDVNQRVQGILDRLEPVADRQDLVYYIRVIDEDVINAVSLPGGYIYVFRGLTDRVKDDDQLAGVIAHELGHITAKHGLKRLQSSYGYMVLQGLAIASRSADLAYGVNTIYTSVFLSYSRQDEFEADRLGVKYLTAAGYRPEAMREVLEVLRAEQKKAPPSQISYFRTHPYLSERVGIVNQEITGALGFRDYLNLTGQEGL